MATAMAPSPTAEATRLTFPERTSPAAKTPGALVSSRRGGRFSGQLFGERDEWADNRELTFHTRTEVEALLDGFDLERFDEVENDGQTALGEGKHWHLFHIVARRRG